jgi:hypothetical protein
MERHTEFVRNGVSIDDKRYDHVLKDRVDKIRGFTSIDYPKKSKLENEKEAPFSGK